MIELVEPTPTPATEQTVVRVRGEDVQLPSVAVAGARVLVDRGALKTARLFDDELIEAASFPTLEQAIDALRASRLRADVLTWCRPHERADGANAGTLPYRHELDNLAVLDTTSYDAWWTGLSQESRKNTRLAGKRGITVRHAPFDNDLVAGIKRIYDETPVRQGRRFWHYGRDLERVRMMNATYLERSRFIGAYLGDQLVGFIKYIRVDKIAVLIQILAMEAQRDKRAIYALLRETVETCHRDGLEQLTYGKLDYGVNKDSSLAEFKRRTGFNEQRFVRWHVPLTLLGRAAVASNLHLGWRQAVPIGLTTRLHKLRAGALQAIYKRQTDKSAPADRRGAQP